MITGPRTIIHRRAFLASASMATASLLSARAFADTPAPTGPFKLGPLPYAFDALEPHIDAKTMELHHDKHHAAYVKNLNTALVDHGEVAAMPLEQMLSKLDQLPESIRMAVRNNGGGHANHTMFWSIMAKDGGKPSADLTQAIDRDFGGLDKMTEQFETAGTKTFGSGWVFVTADGEGKLKVVSKPNQDTPLMDGRRAILGNDVWEHAYYLKYQNRRADYLKAWWNVVNWTVISARYASAKQGTLGI